MLEQAKFVGVRWISQKYDEASLIIWSPQHSDFEGPMEINVCKPWGFFSSLMVKLIQGGGNILLSFLKTMDIVHFISDIYFLWRQGNE